MADSDGDIRANAVYTIRDVCQILKVSDATLRHWIKDGKIRPSRVGRAYRFLGTQVFAALETPAVRQELPAPRRGRPARVRPGAEREPEGNATPTAASPD
jgi:excisionase family DNA binding protein